MERGWERSWERRGGSRGVAAGSGTPPERLQLVVLGAGGVGKSALSARFAQSYFVPHHAPTIEDSYSTLCTIDHLPACLHIVDTSGQEDFGVQRQQQLRGGEGFLLVFAIDDRRSFGALGRLLGQILQVKDREGTPVVLLGNKADLSPLRQVSREEAQAFARQHRLRYLETSAKTQLNVEEAFQELVRAVRWGGATPRPPQTHTDPPGLTLPPTGPLEPPDSPEPPPAPH
ncbi:ras-related protein R-Ras-like isoform X3 [Melanerpes formicivorus]|uniref:ras-related protein R-Ras-like isoform X3 n=1 Tax=Melanerpes formicivorus TaxID=211600 RepID=UPI00358F30F2